MATLALMIIITLVGIAAIDQATTDIDISFNQQHKDMAFYIAEAGLKQAMAKIQSNPGWDSGFVDVNFGNGLFNVEVIDSSSDASLGDTIIIRSYGEVQDSHSGVEAWVGPDVINPFKFALFGDETVDIRNSMNTDSYNSDSGSFAATQINNYGSVGSNGDIIVKNGAFVGGDALTSKNGGLDINAGATIVGDTSSTVPKQEMPPITAEEFAWAETNNDAMSGISGDFSYSPASNDFTASRGSVTFTEGVYYFNDFILKNSAEVLIPAGDKVEIYINGSMEIKNSGDINAGGDPQNLMIYSSCDIVLKNSGTLTGVFYSPEGSADLRNSSDFYGAVVANDIICHNSAAFHYDRSLGAIKKQASSTVKQIGWRQID